MAKGGGKTTKKGGGKKAAKPAAKKTKATKTTKATKSKVKPVVKEEPVVETPAVETAEVEPVKTPVVKKPLTPRLSASTDVNKVPDLKLEDNISSQLETLLGTISGLVTQLKTVQAEVKTLQKNYNKVLKDHNKTLQKRKTTNRQPSGFAKPSKISEEMASFLSLDASVEIPRNQVTKLINQYIIEHDLRNEADKRQIQPNKELSKLLNLKGDEQLSYFNLQKYMKHHFIKAPPAVAVA